MNFISYEITYYELPDKGKKHWGIQLHLPLIFVSLISFCLSGCNPAKDAWLSAKYEKSLVSYEKFLIMYPQSEDAQQAQEKIDEYLSVKGILEAAENGDYENTMAILDRKPELVNAKGDYDITPLHMAALPGLNGSIVFVGQYSRVVELLINRGADINALTNPGKTSPLHAVTAYQTPESEWKVLINNKPFPKHLQEMQLESLKIILSKKPDKNAKSVEGFTPLHLAVLYNHPQMVEILINHGANLQARTNEGYSALDIAEKKGFANIVTILKKHEQANN